MHKILLVERDSPSNFCWSNLVRKKKVLGMSVEDILYKYQGFEGQEIAFCEDKDSNLKEAVVNFLKIRESFSCIMLHILSDNQVMPLSFKRCTEFVGYEVGICEKNKTLYSSIFNEILFGNLLELIAYLDCLNQNFLFLDRSIAEKYINLHQKLSAQGKDIEDYEEMNIYQIWKQLTVT